MFRMLGIFFFVLFSAVASASAYTEGELYSDFDARLLTADEKRFLQTALAFDGYYNGMIDGAWGRGSQASLERYVSTTLQVRGKVPNWAVALIAGTSSAVFQLGGWEERYFPELDMSFLVPSGQLRQGEVSDIFINFNHTASSLGYSLTRGDAPQVMRLHEFTVGRAVAGSEPYTVRKSELWITSTRTTDGVTLYTRSDFRRGAWSTIMLSASDRDSGILAAVSGSIRQSAAPAIYFPSGTLSRGWALVQAISEQGKDGEPPSGVAAGMPEVRHPSQSEAEGGASSGTGFMVSSLGHVLTNAHVVEGCRTIQVEGSIANLLASDSELDLALLQSKALAGQPGATFAASPAVLNSDLTVAGYPLVGILGGLNVTRGSLSSLKGFAGDTSTMQISAPVQPGNSGGPVLNSDGQIVGVVVSKLDAKLVSDAIGDIPQNVNFAIRGEIAKLFLVQNNVLPVTAAPQDKPTPEALAQIAVGITKFISCE